MTGKKRIPVIVATSSLFGESIIHRVFIIPADQKGKIPPVRYQEGDRYFTKHVDEYIDELKKSVTIIDEIKMDDAIIIHA